MYNKEENNCFSFNFKIITIKKLIRHNCKLLYKNIHRRIEPPVSSLGGHLFEVLAYERSVYWGSTFCFIGIR